MGCNRIPPPFAHQLARLAAGKLYAVPTPPVDTEGKNPPVRVDWGILCCQAEKYQENFQKIMNNL